MLRYYRKLRNMSVSDVAESLAENDINVAIKTIYGWENGTTQPDADTLLFLCKIYGIENILGTFGYKTPDTDPIILTTAEKRLIKNTAVCLNCNLRLINYLIYKMILK